MNSKGLIIAGTHSGSGKTTVTLGIMAALSALGHTVQPFKCGPDFIDPTLHKLITGRNSRNLDLWMTGEPFCHQSFWQQQEQADVSVIEGVMGMYDGGDSSSAALACKLKLPVILVLDVRSQAESAAAVVKGFETLAPGAIKGVILNRIASLRHLELIAEAIQEHCQAELLGYLPRSLNFAIPERHLGLHMGDETPITQEAVAELAATVNEHVDLDRLLELATIDPVANRPQEASAVLHQAIPPLSSATRIAVAKDKTFCFYYEDNLDLLRAAGAELIFFSPLTDTSLPENITAVYLGGGYPELHAKTLSENKEMLSSIKFWVEQNGITYAECGGFMYLTQGITDKNDRFHPMAGVYPVRAHMQQKRARLGYREIHLMHNCFLGPAGTILRGHEFHYSTTDAMPPEITRIYAVNNGTEEGYRYKNALGGYMHLHFGFSPQALSTLVQAATAIN